MDNDYIKDRIDTIFETEKINLQHSNKHFHFIEKSKPTNENPSDPVYKTFAYPPLTDLKLRPHDNFYLEWDTYNILKQLYNKIQNNPEHRNFFIAYIKDKLINGYSFQPLLHGHSDYYDISSLAFYFLMKIGKNDENIDVLKIINKKNKKKRTTREGLINDLIIFMHLESSYFDNNILNSLNELNFQYICYKESPINFLLEEKINSMKYSKLKDELKDISE